MEIKGENPECYNGWKKNHEVYLRWCWGRSLRGHDCWLMSWTLTIGVTLSPPIFGIVHSACLPFFQKLPQGYSLEIMMWCMNPGKTSI